MCPADHRAAAGPDPEIEVTDEMLVAGERALLEIGCTDADPAVCALRAYEAMERVRRTFQEKD
jgi:hypothetical protein